MSEAIELDPSQAHAVTLACTAPLGIITGGPGTGKSTCLRFALDRLDARGAAYALAAPTGKASKRIHETTGRPARTIHRLLEYSLRSGGFQRNADNPLKCECVIVDESSMIDIELAAALLAAIDPSETRLILVGDADQLPPVGPGRLFGDLVDAEAVPIARLTTLHRAARESWIAVNAPKILAGEPIDLTEHHDFRFIEIEDAAAVLPAVRHLVCEYIPQKINRDAQTLIPQKPGPAGIELANRLLQDALNPRQPDAPYLPRGKSAELRPGDRVIQTKNDYERGVFNGEVGELIAIRSTSAGGTEVAVLFDGREVPYSLDAAGALQHAYALTVHRAQGSEFPWVVAVAHSTHTYMLTRQLLYTALTRAKQGVLLVGNRAGIEAALSARKPAKRNTGLIERMRGELEAGGGEVEP